MYGMYLPLCLCRDRLFQMTCFVSIILLCLHFIFSFFAGERARINGYYNKKGVFRIL